MSWVNSESPCVVFPVPVCVSDEQGDSRLSPEVSLRSALQDPHYTSDLFVNTLDVWDYNCMWSLSVNDILSCFLLAVFRSSLQSIPDIIRRPFRISADCQCYFGVFDFLCLIFLWRCLCICWIVFKWHSSFARVADEIQTKTSAQQWLNSSKWLNNKPTSWWGHAKTLRHERKKSADFLSLMVICSKPWPNYSTLCRLNPFVHFYAVFHYLLQPTSDVIAGKFVSHLVFHEAVIFHDPALKCTS